MSFVSPPKLRETTATGKLSITTAASSSKQIEKSTTELPNTTKVPRTFPHLRLNKSTLFRIRRLRESAPDDRFSSKCMGAVATVVLCLVPVILVACDLSNLFIQRKKKRSKNREWIQWTKITDILYTWYEDALHLRSHFSQLFNNLFSIKVCTYIFFRSF